MEQERCFGYKDQNFERSCNLPCVCWYSILFRYADWFLLNFFTVYIRYTFGTWKKIARPSLVFMLFVFRRGSSCKYLVDTENGGWPVVDPPGMDTARCSPLFKVGGFYIKYLIFNLLIATTGTYLLDHQLLGLDSLKVARAAEYNIYFILVGTRQMIMRWSILVGASWWPFGNGFAQKMIRNLNLSRIHLIFWAAILSVRLLIKRGSYWHSKLLYLS